MAFNINDFKNQGLIGGGARPSLFEVKLTLPSILGDSSANKLTFTCRASSIPAATLDSVDVPYFGRKIKLAGDRTFADWSVTIMNDEDYVVRSAMEKWSTYMNTMIGNIRRVDQFQYKSDATVTAFGKAGIEAGIANYKFVGIFPTTVDAMELDWDSTNTIQTFGVTFAYDYWQHTEVTETSI
jgi:hypothetical protein